MYREIKDYTELENGEVYWIEYVVWEDPETDFVMSGIGVFFDGNWFESIHGDYLAQLGQVRRIWEIEGPSYEYK